MMPNFGVSPIDISTRTPHAGSDQPTTASVHTRHNFNPHSPCGE